MAAPPYMKLYIGDYLGDTHHLGALEHGAYLLLLMAMWRAGGTLPSADRNLAKIARCTPDEWAEIREAVLAFFKHSRGRLTHKRVSEEIAKYESISGKRSEAGKAGVSIKTSKNSAKAQAIASVLLPISEAIAPITRTITKEGTSVPSSGRGVGAKPKPAKRVPDEWQPSDSVLAVGAGEGFTPGEIERELAKFRDHEFRDGRSDWDATARKWLRTAAERRPRTPMNGQRSHPDRRQEAYAERLADIDAAMAVAVERVAGRA